MEYKKFEFSPKDGFLDSSFYPDTPGNPREVLQKQHNQTRDYINNLVNTLNSKMEGESGSESIKSPSIKGVYGNNTYEQIKDIKRQLDEVALSSVPDESITEEKLSRESVSTEKLKNGSVTTDKLSSDVVIPCAEEALKLNSLPSSLYEPAFKSGSVTVFKELVCKDKVKSVYGKTVNGKRYFLQDDYICFIDLDSGELTTAVGLPCDSDVKFVVTDDERIFTLKYLKSGMLEIYEYEREEEKFVLILDMLLITYEPDKCYITDVACDGEFLYFGIAHVPLSEPSNTLYKISFLSLERCENLVVLNGAQSGTIFFSGEDIIYCNYMYRDKNFDESTYIPGVIADCNDGKILMAKGDFVLVCEDTLLPVIACESYSSNSDDFLYKGYLYKRIGNYLFKTRLL